VTDEFMAYLRDLDPEGERDQASEVRVVAVTLLAHGLSVRTADRRGSNPLRRPDHPASEVLVVPRP